MSRVRRGCGRSIRSSCSEDDRRRFVRRVRSDRISCDRRPGGATAACREDIKTVQARMRHSSARTTLDTYGHLWPDADESTRTADGAVTAARIDSVEIAADPLRTEAT